MRINFSTYLCFVIVAFAMSLGGVACFNSESSHGMVFVSEIDGDRIFTGCGLGLRECSSEHPCPVHDQFMSVRNGLKKMCENTLVMELASNLEEGETFLKV